MAWAQGAVRGSEPHGRMIPWLSPLSLYVILNAWCAHGNVFLQENKMQRGLLVVLVGVMIVCSVGPALGKECHGVTFPEQTSVQNSTLTLNGLGLRQATVLKVNVYVAALYVAQKSTDANAILAANTPKQLVLHF